MGIDIPTCELCGAPLESPTSDEWQNIPLLYRQLLERWPVCSKCGAAQFYGGVMRHVLDLPADSLPKLPKQTVHCDSCGASFVLTTPDAEMRYFLSLPQQDAEDYHSGVISVRCTTCGILKMVPVYTKVAVQAVGKA